MSKSKSAFSLETRPSIGQIIAGVALVTLALLAVIFFWFYAASGYEPQKIKSVFVSPKGGEFIGSVFVSVIAGVISAFAYSVFDNSKAKKIISEINSSGPSDLVEEALDFIRQNKSTLLFDQNTVFTLRRQGDDKFLRLNVVFKYKKKTPTQKLDFHIVRLKNQKLKDEFYKEESTQQFNSMYRSSELFYPIDEVDLRKQFGPKLIEDAYKLNYVKVNDKMVALVQAPSDPHCQTHTLESNRDTTKPISIEYSFEFAVTESDIQYCMQEFPTFGISIKFVRDSTIKECIFAEAYEMMSVTQGTATIREIEPGCHEVTHSGWILPKSSAVFFWYLTQATSP